VAEEGKVKDEDDGKVSFDEMAAAFEKDFVRKMYGEIRLELRRRGATRGQGLTLVHFSAQLEPCLTQSITLHTLNTP